MDRQIKRMAAVISGWRDDPVSMVGDLFSQTPDPWQQDALRLYASQNRLVMQGSKGVGNTAALVWMAWNFLLTRPRARVSVASCTVGNLRDNFWADLSRMHSRSALLREQFVVFADRVFRKDNPEDWLISARNTKHGLPEETFAGIFGENVLLLIDEAGSVSPLVLAGAEASADVAAYGKIVAGGIPAHDDSLLYVAAVEKKWPVVRASGDPDDPKRSPRIRKEWAEEQIANFERHNPFVKINVLGEFP